jgi:hypothetical protein
MRLLLVGGTLVLAAAPLGAQSWQTMTVERASTAQPHLDITVRQHVGRLQIQASDDSMRYRASMRFNARSMAPLYSLGADGGLQIGTHERRGGSSGDARSTILNMSLGRVGTLALDARADAAETMLDLGGLPLTSVAVSSGASDMRVRFDEPNPVRMKSLTLSTGAASINGERLGNANAAQIVVRVGVGEIELDLSGTWQDDTDLRAEVVLGVLSIRVPSQIGVRVETSRVLASFSHSGLRPRDGAFVSENWDSAPHKLTIYAQTTVGFLTIERR